MLSQQEILKKLTSFEQDSKVLEPQGKQMENQQRLLTMRIITLIMLERLMLIKEEKHGGNY